MFTVRVACPLLTLLLALGSPAAAAAPSIQILPGDVTLHGPEAMQRVAVVRVVNGQPAGLVGAGLLQLESSDPGVFQVRDSVLVPAGNGTAQLIVKAEDQTVASAQVQVEGFASPHRWSFRNEVESVIARLGCNTGACHGALAGKGGFRLTLGGYDPAADHRAITREAQGRRVELADPGRSLLLAKPTGALPHKGGLRLDVDSRDYRVLSQWIAQGAAAPADADPQLQRISVLPENSLLQPDDEAQILVRAHYDDGRIVDVTHWARFSATDEAVGSVDPQGRVSVRGPGEGAVLAWFGSQVALARLTVPYPFDVPAETYADAPRRNFIDDLTLDQLQTLRLEPSPRCSDRAFIRRATLDCIGRLPTEAEVQAFLSADATQRRDALIEQLLARDEFVDYWTYKWSDVLLVSGTRLRPAGVESFYKWIREAVRRNQPWDQLVQEILTATGSSVENGATNFYALHQTPEELTENACQAFMGLSIGCAKCHNHPLEKWTNDQYYAMANLCARVRGKGWGGDSRNGDGIRTVYVAESGDLLQPSTGRPQPPAPLDAPPLAIDDPADRREPLAQWMTAPENPYFGRAITNRVWANFFGVGLVEQVDDLRLSNPASNEPLLAAATEHLVDADFDLKQLMRTIMQSETYQRSSLPLPRNEPEQRYFSRYYPRRLMAEVLLDSIDQVLGTASRFDQVAFPGADRQKTDFYPPGTRAIQLYDSAVESYFLKAFGRNPREITCECERSDEPSMVQVLHLSNGTTLNEKLSAADNVIGRHIDAGLSDAEILTQLFLSALARQPTGAEQDEMLTVIAEYGDKQRRQAIEDAYWSVLSSTEFVFNH